MRAEKLVIRDDRGTLRSRINKPLWRVPLADFTLADESWTPIPRFIITEYCRMHHNAVLLPVLIYHQHLSWGNESWVGVPTLCRLMGNWRPTRVRSSLRAIGNADAWADFLRKQRLPKSLPRPLEILWVPTKDGKPRRRFSVLAMHYHGPKRKKKYHSFVSLTEQFRTTSTWVMDPVTIPANANSTFVTRRQTVIPAASGRSAASPEARRLRYGSQTPLIPAPALEVRAQACRSGRRL